MIPFKAPVDDILFSLEHVAGARDLPSWDSQQASDILHHFSAFAEAVIAPLNASGDREGARLVDGRVRMPTGFAQAYSQLASGGWQGLSAPEAFGGMGISKPVAAGVSEVFAAANHAMQMLCALVPGAVDTLLRFGSAAQQAEWLPKLASGEVLSTMCLTESDAGSDLSAIRCCAAFQADGWRITGEKIFISGGDQDMSRDILHLVLARSGKVSDGLNGLSLFLCPAQHAVRVTRIEEKIGLHASPTCQLGFKGARAELIGEEGAGLKAMFTLMNHARIDVALQGVAHAARAAQIASAYARERQQGRRGDGSRAVLRDHADVRRMLDEQQRLAIGARAMCHIALVEMEKNTRPALAEFLTPLCKIVGSEAGIRSADLGIQILGGYGYLREYQLGQIWRDARITAIYEGANGIHARTLATRCLRPGGGADEFAMQVEELAGESDQARLALRTWRDMARDLRTCENPLPRARAFAEASADVMQQAVWCRIRKTADGHPRADEMRRIASL